MPKPPGFPPVIAVRVVRGDNLPPGVHVGLPGAHPTPTEERVPGHIYLEGFLPTNDEHHAALGAFMDAWSRVETALTALIAALLGVSFAKGSAVFQNLSVNRAAGVLTALGTAQLTDQAITALSNLSDRINHLNIKRNALVHGIWTLEFKVWGWKGEVRHRAEFSRETIPYDARVRGRLHDLNNQKDRSKYIYGVKRIRTVILEVQKLTDDLVLFTQTGLSLRPSQPWRVSEFLSPLHSRTHPTLSCRIFHYQANPSEAS